MASLLRKPLIFSLLLALAACAVNPVTGKKEFSIVSAQQEVAIGEKNYAPSQQSQGGRYYIDPEIQLYVAEVGRKLAKVSDRPNLPYEFVVLNNPTPNAWALPGGKIAINSGLLIHLESEAELAAVLGHEIVHAAARHSASQMSRGALIGLGAQAVAIAGDSYGYGQVAGIAAQLGSSAWMAHYGRDDELESDYYGMEYMAKAGYDPQGAVELQKTFVKLSEGRQQDFLSGLFASHPPSQQRVDANIEKAKTLPKGQDYKERYQQKIAQLIRDEPAYEAQKEAIKALKDKDGNKALSHLDKAKSIQPRDAYTWELRGHAWKMLDNTANAETAFTTAISKNPDYYSPYLARGLIRYENNKRDAAKLDFEKSYRLLPTQTASYYLGEMALQGGNQKAALSYYQVAAQGSNELGKSAQGKLAVLELEQNPAKYIPSALSLSSDGYLVVTVQNNSPVTVNNVQLQVSKMKNAFMVSGSQTVTGPKSLQAGARVSFKTRIGRFASNEEANDFRVKVIRATPAQ